MAVRAPALVDADPKMSTFVDPLLTETVESSVEAEPKMSTFDEPLTVALRLLPEGVAEPKIPMSVEPLFTITVETPVAADPKISIFDEPETVAVRRGPLDEAEPKMSTFVDPETDAVVRVGLADPKTVVVILFLLVSLVVTPLRLKSPLPKMLTFDPLLTATELPALAEPKMSMLVAPETWMVETVVEAEPNASIDVPLPPFVP
jgi:hypothetical protein